MPIIKVKELTVEEAREQYPVLWDTYNATFLAESLASVAKMVSIAVGTCPHCWEKPVGCSCMKEE
jgi:hypothetical protein